MSAAALPANETQRLNALLSCRVLDTEPELAFDHIVQLASQICGTPIALVSLVDRSRQWFKARVGLDATETPRDTSFCAHAILSEEPLVVQDTRHDARFAENPLVLGDPHIRFYAGVPLTLEHGLALGSLCVIDRVPRELTAAQLNALSLLAKQVVSELDLRRRLAASTSAGRGASAPVRAISAGEHTLVDRFVPGSLEASAVESRLPVPAGELVDGRYLVERVLGVGGMGIVAACADRTSGDRVAIKFMLPEALPQREALQRFVREARALNAIKSEHVARMRDVGNLPDGTPYIVMEYLEGVDLAERLRRGPRLSLQAKLDIVLQACAGIVAAHGCGVLHRDLKPGNLFLTRQPDGAEQVKLLDFGISKIAGRSPVGPAGALTSAQTQMGSPHYMAPEQMLHPERVDERVDIWALGVILYELIDGGKPFSGYTFAEICVRVVSSPHIPLATADRDDPLGRLAAVVDRCLAKEPVDRYATALELQRALQDVQELMRER
jgi:hypothetical protein